MLDRLKEAHYRHKFGPERAALIVKVEKGISVLPKDAFSKEEIERLWSLPPERWLRGLEFFRERSLMMADREVAVKIVTRKNRLSHLVEGCEGSVPPEIERACREAVVQVDRIKKDLVDRERRVRELASEFADA